MYFDAEQTDVYNDIRQFHSQYRNQFALCVVCNDIKLK